MSDAKRQYLAVYDYGQGGLWAVIAAISPQQIVAKYPMLSVVDVRPSWMDDAEYNRIVSKNFFDIDGTPPEWLALAGKEQK